MLLQIFIFYTAFITIVTAAGTPSWYSLDSPGVCHETNVVTKWLEEDDVIILHGKKEINEFHECVIKFGPSSRSQKKTVQVKVELFYNEDCGVFLAAQQSPTAFFNERVSVLFNFTCNSRPLGNVYHADANSNIKIFLLKRDKTSLNYNFILNITLVEHAEVTPGISTAVVISIAVIIAIAIPGVGCIVYRYLKVKKWTKQQCESNGIFGQSSMSHITDGSPQDSSRYSNLPLSDTEPRTSLHSQTCIVGTQGSDGLCTVCHRQHADFAHVVDIGPNGEILDNCSHGTGHHARHDQPHAADRDGLLHGSDSRSSTPRNRRQIVHSGAHPGVQGANRHAPASSQSGTGMGSGSRLWPPQSQSVPSSGLARSGEFDNGDVDDDDDIDLSGNDLIPPSYDLSPPSYDEALKMPKPDSENTSVAAGYTADVSETDPLYQNISTLSNLR